MKQIRYTLTRLVCECVQLGFLKPAGRCIDRMRLISDLYNLVAMDRSHVGVLLKSSMAEALRMCNGLNTGHCSYEELSGYCLMFCKWCE